MKKLFIALSVAVAMICLSPGLPLAAKVPTVTLTWTAPTTNTDGTPLTDLAGYKLYYGKVSGTYTSVITIVGNVTTYTVTGLLDGTYYFVVTAYDAVGNESAYSNQVSYTIDTLAPSRPGNLNAPLGVQYL